MEAGRASQTPARAGIAGAVRQVSSRVGARTAVWSFTVLLACLAGAVLSTGPAQTPSPFGPLSLAAPLVAVLYLVAEWFPLHLRVRRETHTFSLTEIPLVIGLFFLPPPVIVLAHMLGAGIALVVHRRQPPMRLAFNLACFAFSTASASWVFHALLGSAEPLGPVGLIAAYAAAVAADQLSGLAVALAIALSGGHRPEFGEHAGLGVAYTFVDASLALAGVIVLAYRPEGLWLLAVPLVTTFVGFRLYQDERVKRESLALLQESTRLLQESLDAEAVMGTLLRQVRDMFSVRVAALVVFGGGTAPAGVTTLDLDDAVPSTDPAPPNADADLVAMLGTRPGSMIVHGPPDRTALRWLLGDGSGEVLLAPIRDGDIVGGVLVAGDRLVHAGAFRPDHVSLFETLANHATVTMKNGSLVEQLRAEAKLNDYQARHDALTAMPNRTLFHERLDAALAVDGATCAVLLLDLDRFKEVNDTLGHQNGDRLLQEAAVRLTAVIADGGLVARVSGDEFAVLIAQPGTHRRSIEERAVELARVIEAALREPFRLEGLALVLTASIGISLSPEHGSTADVLIRHADVAMYNAKHDPRVRFEVYRADRDEYSPARLALIADLRAAVESDQLEVAYQMLTDASSGRVEGAEALVRWRHPVWGLLQPVEFIALAEHAGLIRALTERVLYLAARDVATWRRRWPALQVAVNLSPRTLFDPTLAPLVRQVLAEHDLPLSALTLEVTESTIVDHALAVEAALRDLSSLGCRISIDDFGTGYSSFSNLRRLAIDELKIDRSFVSGMATNASDRAIVEMTIELAHRLGMRTVAEGVETDQQADMLVRYGCDALQGYLISRPVSNEAFIEAVEARERRARAA